MEVTCFQLKLLLFITEYNIRAAAGVEEREQPPDFHQVHQLYLPDICASPMILPFCCDVFFYSEPSLEEETLCRDWDFQPGTPAGYLARVSPISSGWMFPKIPI